MLEVYYYIPANEAEYVIECGLKLSRWYSREVLINGVLRKCLTAFLNPKDDLEKYRSQNLKCVKLEVATGYCFVADSWLYAVGEYSPEARELYVKSIVPVESYIFGTYRLPECLITTTVIGGNISPLDKRRDSPVLFDNSEELYINNIIEAQKESHPEFYDAMLYYFYLKLSEEGKYIMLEDRAHGIAAFVDKSCGRAYTFRIPDLAAY